MLKVNYEYKKGFLVVNLEGILDSRNMYELINSIKVITTWNGINRVILDIEKVIALSDKYIKYIIEDMSEISIDLKGYNF